MAPTRRCSRRAAVQDGDEWVINGEKWFSSFADIAVVPHRDGRDRSRRVRRTSATRCSWSRARRPASTSCATSGSATSRVGGGREGYVRYEDVRVPADHMLGPRGGAFVVAQTRLGRRSHPPRHAHRRPGAAHLRHAVRARGVALHAGRDARQQAARPGDDRRLVDGDRVVPAAHAADRVEDRPVRRLQGGARPTSPRSRR